MNLDAMAVNIRPRTPWEALDMGFVLARNWFWPLWRLWLMAAFPCLLLALGAGLFLPGAAAKWALGLFWLAKPFYERPLVHWVSRALFGDTPRLRDALRAGRRGTPFKQRRYILFNRLGPFRSFWLPVIILEALSGKPLHNRLKLLKDGCEAAALLTIAGFCIECLLIFSFFSTLFWLIPEELRWMDFGEFVFRPDTWVLLFSYFAGCSLFAPFYICAGFMMYISRRVILEAWDIEIGFKRIRQRYQERRRGALQRTLMPLIWIVLLSPLWLHPAPARAASPDPQEAKQAIEEVLDQNDFGKKVTEYHWVPKVKKSKASQKSGWVHFFEALEDLIETIGALLAKIGEILLWLLAGAILAFVLLRYTKMRGWLARRRLKSNNRHSHPEILFGMDLRPESLPADIRSASTELLNAGRKRAAISLLYRGTLRRLLDRHPLQIASSFTENECHQEIERNCPAPEATFFRTLSALWIDTAYAHRDPRHEDCQGLIQGWQALYGEAT